MCWLLIWQAVDAFCKVRTMTVNRYGSRPYITASSFSRGSDVFSPDDGSMYRRLLTFSVSCKSFQRIIPFSSHMVTHCTVYQIFVKNAWATSILKMCLCSYHWKVIIFLFCFPPQSSNLSKKQCVQWHGIIISWIRKRKRVIKLDWSVKTCSAILLEAECRHV